MSRHDHRAGVRPVAGGPRMLASDADRDAAAGLLNAAFAEGRLTAEEHHDRLGAAFQARTWQQLRQLTADVPAAPGPARRGARPGLAAEPDRCLLCLLLCACPPAGITWWLLSRRRPGSGPDEQPGVASDREVTAELPPSGHRGRWGA